MKKNNEYYITLWLSFALWFTACAVTSAIFGTVVGQTGRRTAHDINRMLDLYTSIENQELAILERFKVAEKRLKEAQNGIYDAVGVQVKAATKLQSLIGKLDGQHKKMVTHN